MDDLIIGESNFEYGITSLARVLCDRVSPGAIATAIEREGISKWDRYGRFVLYKADSVEGRQALDIVAQVWSLESSEGQASEDYDPADPAYEPRGGPGDPSQMFGWMPGSVPNFKQAGQPPNLRGKSSGHTKTLDTLYLVIMALLNANKINIKDRGYVKRIQLLVEDFGYSVNDDTIRNHLNPDRMSDALLRRERV